MHMIPLALSAILLLLLNLTLVSVLLYFERKRPAATWAWLLLILFTSLPGFAFYIIAGRSPRKRSLSIRKQLSDEQLRSMLHEEHTKSGILVHDESVIDPRWHDIVRFHYAAGTSYLTHGNAVELYTSGIAKFAALLESLEMAKVSIHLEYYIFRNDTIGRAVLNLLEKKAAEGVDVRVIHDGLGTWGLPRRFFNRLKGSGGNITCFFPPYIPPFRFQLKYRNHRKICIIDNAVAFLGGFNIGDEYLGRNKKIGPWRDTHLRIAGPAVAAIAQCFLLDWQFARREKPDFAVLGRRPLYAGREGGSMQIVTSGPDSRWASIHDGYLKIISSARTTLHIQTPYFIPDESILRALMVASLSGVSVKIMVPRRPDHPFVHWATWSYLGEILDSGIECHIYEDGFLHSKVITADGTIASVGSANMDIRSFELNFEINACIYDQDIVQKLDRAFAEDLGHCTRLTTDIYSRRSAWVRTREGIARLLAPIM